MRAVGSFVFLFFLFLSFFLHFRLSLLSSSFRPPCQSQNRPRRKTETLEFLVFRIFRIYAILALTRKTPPFSETRETEKQWGRERKRKRHRRSGRHRRWRGGGHISRDGWREWGDYVITRKWGGGRLRRGRRGLFMERRIRWIRRGPGGSQWGGWGLQCHPWIFGSCSFF